LKLSASLTIKTEIKMKGIELKIEIQTIEEVQNKLNNTENKKFSVSQTSGTREVRDHTNRVIPRKVEAYCPRCNDRKIVSFIGCSYGISRMFLINYNCECDDTISKIIYGNVGDYEVEKES